MSFCTSALQRTSVVTRSGRRSAAAQRRGINDRSLFPVLVVAGAFVPRAACPLGWQIAPGLCVWVERDPSPAGPGPPYDDLMSLIGSLSTLSADTVTWGAGAQRVESAATPLSSESPIVSVSLPTFCTVF